MRRPTPARVLGAGRIGGHGNRSRRGGRRRDRAAPAVRPAAARRRRDHRRGVAAAAAGPGPPRPADVRAGHHRPAAGHRDRLPDQPVRRTALRSARWSAGLVPRFDGAESVLLATAMLGATVMPHAVYLHSGLARDRHGHPEAGPARRRLLRVTRWDVGIAMLVAGAVNLAMLLVAATNLQGMRRHRLHRGRARRRAATRSARRSRCSSRSACWRRGWRRRRSAPTPAR